MRVLSPVGIFDVYLVLLLLLPSIFVVISTEISDVDQDFPNERNALVQLRDILNSTGNLHSNWTGPPCNNNQSRWAGIACSNGHVTHLVLEGIKARGSIPPLLLQNVTFLTKLSLRNNSIYGPLPNLSSLLYLEFVFLSYNQFSGSIPFAYVNLSKLTKLELQENHLQGPIPPFDQQTLIAFNVSHNQLNGSIPETPVLQRFPESSYDSNSNLCGSPLRVRCPIFSPPPPPSNVPAPPPIPSGKGRKGVFKLWRIAVIAAAAALAPFSIVLFFFCYYRRNRKRGSRSEKHGKAFTDHPEKKSNNWSESTDDPERRVELEFFDRSRPVFDLDDLLRASAEVIGRGKLGTTYKAVIEGGPTVAVKRLKEMNDLSKKEFVQQTQLLGKLKHENLVEFISYYHAKNEKLLVYEYVSHGNLFELLHENRGIGRQRVDWRTRLSIIKDIAKGLNYLHQSLPSHKVPHGNLKSTNVLLHQNSQGYHSKLSDYGFFPLLPSRKSSEKLAVSKSPEFCEGRKVTGKADIYCFGIVLLEIITGKTPVQNSQITVDDLSDWVRTVVHSDWSTDILDVEIVAEKEGYDDMLKLTKIALECTDVAPEKRPKMSEVLRRIQEIKDKHT